MKKRKKDVNDLFQVIIAEAEVCLNKADFTNISRSWRERSGSYAAG